MSHTKVEIIQPGKTLYHGSIRKLDAGMPTGKNGTWFATNPVQSILHVAARSNNWKDEPMYFYIYKVEKPIRVLKFESSANMNNWAVRSGWFERPKKTYAFSNQNYKLAEHVCKAGIYAGWWFPNDQSQVMLCRPAEYLRFVKVMEIKFPYGKPEGIVFKLGNNKGQYIVNENGRKYKYKLVDVKLNNLRNIYNVPKNAIYSIVPTNSDPTLKVKYFKADGTPLPNMNKNKLLSKNGFILNGKRYFKGLYANLAVNKEHMNKLRERIFSKTGNKFYPPSWTVRKTNIVNENRLAQLNKDMEIYRKLLDQYRLNVQNYAIELTRRKRLKLPTNNLVLPIRPNILNTVRYFPEPLPLPEPRKTMNNINLNAGPLFKQTNRRNNNG